MSTAVEAECKHNWKIDEKNVGTCSKCGEVRQFPFEPRGVSVLIKAGGGSPKAETARLNYHDTQCTKQEKIGIVRQIKEVGVDQVAEETGINPQTLRTWRRRYGERVGIIIEHRAKPGRPPGSVKKEPAPTPAPSPEPVPSGKTVLYAIAMRTPGQIRTKLESLLELKGENLLIGSPNAEGYIAALQWVLGGSVAGS